MFRILKKIRAYQARLGATRVAKILFLIVLAKMFARRLQRFSSGWPVQKLVLAGVKQPVYVRTGTTDIEVMQQILLDCEYEFALPKSPKVIVDAGANIGLASVYFANIYPDATIVALEPDWSNFKILEMNVAGYPRIKAMNVALWCENKEINLFSPNGGHCGFRTSEEKAEGFQPAGLVSAVTVDAVMKMLGVTEVDVLKVDIEGAELEVFHHSAAWINQVDTFMVELHDGYKAGCSDSFYAAAPRGRQAGITKGETIFLVNRTPA